jgi:hypothetical protein
MSKMVMIDDQTSKVVNVGSRIDDAIGFTVIRESDWAAADEPLVGMVWNNAPDRPATFGWPEAVNVSGDLADLSIGELRAALAESTARTREELDKSTAIQAALDQQLDG